MARQKTATESRKKTESNKILEAVATLDPNNIINEIGTLQSSVQSTLAGVSATISTKIEELKKVNDAIALREERLKELFEIEQEAMLIEEVRAKKAEEEADYKDRQQKRSQMWKEEDALRQKELNRQDEERQWSEEQKKKRFEEDFNATVAKHQRDEKIRQADLERSWKEREESLKTQEQEVADLRKQVAEFDTKLKSEVSKEVSIATSKMKRDSEHQMEVLKLQHESEKKLHESEVKSLNFTIQSLRNQINDLQSQLVEARKDAKEVTQAALTSASGRQALDTLLSSKDKETTSTKK